MFDFETNATIDVVKIFIFNYLEFLKNNNYYVHTIFSLERTHNDKSLKYNFL